MYTPSTNNSNHMQHMLEFHKEKTHCTNYEKHKGYENFLKRTGLTSNYDNMKYPCYICQKEGVNEEEICIPVMVIVGNTLFSSDELSSRHSSAVKNLIGQNAYKEIMIPNTTVAFERIINIVYQSLKEDDIPEDKIASKLMDFQLFFNIENMPHVFYHICETHNPFQSLTTLMTLFEDNTRLYVHDD